MAHELKVGDTGPSLRAQLIDSLGKIVNLTGAVITFRMTPALPGQGSTVDAAAVVDYIDPTQPGLGVDPSLGKVRYDFVAGDTDTPGVHRGEFHVVFGGVVAETFPSGDYLDVVIHPAA